MVFLPLLELEYREVIENGLETEDENIFHLNLAKLQEQVPLFAKSKDSLERIHIDIRESHQQEEVQQVNAGVVQHEEELKQHPVGIEQNQPMPDSQ